jgi:hypothetical protein
MAKGLKLKLPQLPKKPIIKGVPNTILAGGGAIAAAGGLYYAYTQGWLPSELTSIFEGAGAAIPGISIGTVTNIIAQPSLLKPGTPLTVTGAVTGTPTVYYYIYEDIQPRGATGRILVSQGQAPVSNGIFSATIQTNTWREGTYTAIASETPLTGDPQIMGGPAGLAGQTAPVSATTGQQDQYSGALQERTDQDYVFDITMG